MSEEDEETKHLIFSQIHDLEERTADVSSDTTFENLMIKPCIIADILRSGYRKPSPVQAKAIPLGLLGMDMLVQAKTGTGKTLVFGVLCADHLLSATKREFSPHVLIVAPTREIAHQISEVVRKLCPKKFFHGLFVGGMDVEQDKALLKKGCQVAVGTAGRLSHLVKCRMLDTRKVSLFVLDEADKLMEDSFRQEVNFLFSSLPSQATQVCVFSATYPRDLEQTLCNYMVEPTLIRLNGEDIQLLGIKQYAVVEENKPDVQALLQLLNTVTYSQCLIFTNDQKRCVDVSTYLNQNNIRATHFSSFLTQEERFKVLKDLKNFRIRVLVSSDLSARGIDAVHVNMIVNLECPYFYESYLHRIGRAGRYGKMGAAFTVLSSSKEHLRFKLLVTTGHLNVRRLDLSRPYPTDLPLNPTYFQAVAPKFVSKIEPKDSYRVRENDVKTLFIPVNSMLIPIRTNVTQQTYSREELMALNESFDCKKWTEYAYQHLHADQQAELIELDRSKYTCENEQTNTNPLKKKMDKSGKRRGSKQGEKDYANGFQQPAIMYREGSAEMEYSVLDNCSQEPDNETKEFQYSKSDLMRIRETLNTAQWLKYLSSKKHWDVHQLPFAIQTMHQPFNSMEKQKHTPKKQESSKFEVSKKQMAETEHKRAENGQFQRKVCKTQKNIANSYLSYWQHVKILFEQTIHEQEVGKAPGLFKRREPEEYARYIERMRKIMEEDNRLLASLAFSACTKDEPQNGGDGLATATEVECVATYIGKKEETDV